MGVILIKGVLYSNIYYMKFSVLLSIYYKESPIYFRESLNSILSQTLRPSEIILVEDGLLTEELDNEINRYLDLHPKKIVCRLKEQ